MTSMTVRAASVILLALLATTGASAEKPRFTLYRVGDDAVVRNIRNVSPNSACELIIFAVEPITARLTLWLWPNNVPSRTVTTSTDVVVNGFFKRHPTSVAAAIMVPRTSVQEISARLNAAMTLLDLFPMFDGRRVFSYDITRVRPGAQASKVHNRFEGQDLVVTSSADAQLQLVTISFIRPAITPATENTVLVTPLISSTGDLVAVGTVRYAGAASKGSEAVSLITTRATADVVKQLVARTPRLHNVGLDVLVRTGLIYAVDIAKTGATPPQPGTVAERLLTILKGQPSPIASLNGPEDITAAVIQSYDAFTKALPQDLLRTPRVYEHANETFLAELAWEQFFKHVSFANSTARIEYIRTELNKRDPTRNIGEEFVFSFADRFLRKYPLTNPDTLDSRLKIAEQYFGTVPQVVRFRGQPLQIDKVIADYYQLVGRFLASDVATVIEKWQSDGTIKLSDDQYLAYAKRLAAMNVYLPERASLGAKLEQYVRRGDWAKLMQRATDKFLTSSDRGRVLNGATYAVTSPRTLANNQIVFYDVTYTDAGTTKPLGHLVLIQPNAKLKYGYTVRKEQAGYTFDELRKIFGAKVFYIVTAGSYTERNLRTSGLSAENGVIKNFHVTHKMDGFVLMRGGTVEILDLENGLTLPGRNDVLRPIRSLRDFHAFITWLRSQGASGFQTHLLVKNNIAAIDPAKTSETRRERRLLLSMKENGTNRNVVAILNIPGSEAINFAEATAVIQRLLSQRYKYAIDSAVNLDTGSFDIFQVRADGGRVMFGTPTDITGATNLVVIYQ